MLCDVQPIRDKHNGMKTKWSEISEKLRNTLDSGIFRVWIAPLSGSIEGNAIKLAAPNAFMSEWVKRHLLAAIRQAASSVLCVKEDDVDIDIAVATDRQTPGPVASASLVKSVLPRAEQVRLAVPAPAASAAGVWRYRFDDFVIGSSNSLAVAAARDMCQSGQVRTLFVTSGPGLGKTHLAQAAGWQMTHSGNPLKVVYLTAEQFASRFVAAMRAKDLESFKQQLCSVDVLLLEDVHFLQRKKAMQEMVLGIIKNLEARGSRVIFTSSFSPRQLQDMDSQLTSHFCSGILASMDKPDVSMRREILFRKAKSFQVALPEEVCNVLSERLSSDVRQLESCLKSMVFKARLLNSGLTVDMAMETLGQYAGAENTLDMSGIVRLVCESFGLTETQLRSRSRKREYVQGRNAVFYLARKHTEMSLEVIGNALNRRHSTVMRSITQVEEEMARESAEGRQLARVVALIERKCGLE